LIFLWGWCFDARRFVLFFRMHMRFQLPTVILLFAACSSPTSQKQTKDTPKPPATKPIEKPQPKLEPKTEPKPATMASQPASAPAATPGATVVFVIDNQMAIPLACFDPATKAFLDAKDSDATCAKLVAASSKIKLSTSSTSTIKEKTEWLCEPAEFKKVAFSIDPQLPTDAQTELAVSPPGTPIEFVARVGETKFTANPDESALLSEAIKKSEPSAKKTPHVHQIATLDLDGDGKEDTIFSATVAGKGSSDEGLTSLEGKFTFSGVFVRYGNKPESLVLLQRQDYDTYEIRGAVDLNNDGRKELIISDTQWEGFGVVIYEVGTDGSLKALGDWGCGA
jgi:hypothetical protein